VPEAQNSISPEQYHLEDPTLAPLEGFGVPEYGLK
jgi:hypothetical protein